MKLLTNEQILFIIEKVCFESAYCMDGCPFQKECLYHYNGEKCCSCLEKEDLL